MLGVLKNKCLHEIALTLSLQYDDATNDRDIQGSHEHLRSLRLLITRQQYQRGMQLMSDSFFKPKPASTVSQPISPDSAFTMASRQKKGGKIKYVHISIADEMELIKKLESRVSVVRACDEYGMMKQTVSDIRRSYDKLTSYAMKCHVALIKNRKCAVHKRKHMKVPTRRVGGSGL